MSVASSVVSRILPAILHSKNAITILHEASRHLLRRPVIGVAAAAHTPDGRWLLIRRGDTGTWALPGGTLEWGETLPVGLEREMLEEAGVTRMEIERVVGVYSRPDRDPRFHAVTIVVRCLVDEPTKQPKNAMEIKEVGLFPEAELPPAMAMGMEDMLRDARGNGPTVFE
jgi:8-oxo-dGTP diphosphatase